MATVKLFNHHIRKPFLFLLIAEYTLLFLAVYAGYHLRFDNITWQSEVEGLQNFELKAIVFASVMIVGMLAMGQYQTPGSQGRHFFPYILIRITISLILGTIGLVFVYYVFPEVLLGRGLTGYAILVSIIGLSLFRTIIYKMIDGRSLRKKILVVGAGKLAFDMIQFDGSTESSKNQGSRTLAPPYASYVIHGFVDIGVDELKIDDRFLIKPGSSLVEYCLEYEIDEIVLAVNDRRKSIPIEGLLECKLSNINVVEYVAFWEKEKGLLRTDMLNPSWLIFCDGCQQGDFESFMVRVFDIFVSLFIISFMSPFLILTAILIFVENGFSGPVFYRQKRVGLNGNVFELLKFRSMIVNAEADGDAKWATKNDARITRIGQYIRKVRIDELPQLLNILRGDMSLVGPRPERPEFVSILEKKLPFYSTRHRVKPGLAGWAQLKYPYGADEHDAMMKLQYDLYYVKNHSIFMDLLVLLQTVEIVLLGKGAR